MCGICGFYNGGTRNLVREMCDTLAHRGPDDAGTFVAGRVGLGMTRLAIIDTAGGRQPMSNEDGSVTVVFNGEIYNYRELRRELERKGHVFRTASDTEVIVHLYEDYRFDCATKLRGIFAFAVWDGETLFLVRDRLGVKPLYYTRVQGRYYFASEIKALLVCPGVKREPDADALDDFMALQYVPSPKTLFRGIYKLPPGHWMKIDGRGPWVAKYWDLPGPGDGAASPRRPEETTRALVEEAVRLRTISDVPFGALLSGGVDSSLVVALLSRVHPEPVKTFHISFAGEDGEAPYARAVAAAHGCEYHELTAEPGDLALLPRIIWHLDEPIADAAAWATYLICRYAREHVKVLLTGEGGDELFCGYPRYVLSRLADRYHLLPAPLRKLSAAATGAFARRFPRYDFGRHLLKIATSAPEPWRRNVAWLSVFSEAERRNLIADDFAATFDGGRAAALYKRYYYTARGRSPVQRLTAADIKTWLADDVLMKVDKASMAVGVEARVPLLDHVLAEYVTRLPDRARVGLLTPKILLKTVARGVLAPEIIDRPKRAFLVPVEKWLRRYWRDWVYDTLTSRRALQRGYFKPEVVRSLVDGYYASGAAGKQVWNLFCLELWHRQFIDAPAAVPGRKPELTCAISS